MTVPAPPVVREVDFELPAVGQGDDQFNTNVANFVDYQQDIGGDYNAMNTWVKATADQVEIWANEAEESATSASEDAETATTQAGIAVAAAASATLAPGTSATSTTTITPGLGSKSFTLAETGKTFVVGGYVTVADPAAVFPNEKWFNGKVTAFDSGAGTMTVDSAAFKGTTSSSSWVVTVTGPAFGQRFTNPTQSFVALGTVSGTVNLDLRLALSFSCTLGGNTIFTFTMPDGYGATDAVSWALQLTQGASAYTIGYPAGTQYHEGAQAVTAVNTTDILVFQKLGTAAAKYRRAGRAFA